MIQVRLHNKIHTIVYIIVHKTVNYLHNAMKHVYLWISQSMINAAKSVLKRVSVVPLSLFCARGHIPVKVVKSPYQLCNMTLFLPCVRFIWDVSFGVS